MGIFPFIGLKVINPTRPFPPMTERPERPIVNSDEIVTASINDRAYSARCSHTVAFAKLVNSYAEAYDRLETITSDARRKRDEADKQEKQAADLRKDLEAIARSIQKHVCSEHTA